MILSSCLYAIKEELNSPQKENDHVSKVLLRCEAILATMGLMKDISSPFGLRQTRFYYVRLPGTLFWKT